MGHIELRDPSFRQGKALEDFVMSFEDADREVKIDGELEPAETEGE